MQSNQKSRLAFLGVSGLLLSAACASWFYHVSLTPEETTVANEVRCSHETGGGVADATASASKASGNSQRATTMPEAVAAARSVAGRQDPMAPAANPWNGAQPAAVVFVPAPPLTVPPPPGERTSLLGQYNKYFATLPHNQQKWRLPQQEEAVEQPEPPLPSNLSVDDVRLVGIVDNKAFFTMPKKLATHLNLPKSFALAAGQKIDNVTVDSVSTDAATIHDGSKIATKELAPIR